MYVYVASFIFIGGYFFCSTYNFLWIVCPSVGILSKYYKIINLLKFFKIHALHALRAPQVRPQGPQQLPDLPWPVLVDV